MIDGKALGIAARSGVAAIFLAAACLTIVQSARAQSYPTRPIRMVVPFPPGPALDLVARLVAIKMSEAMGQQILVENRSGANGAIGSEAVARAAPDGYTLLAATASTHVTAIFLTKNLPYDPVKDFTPITASVEPATCLVVHPSVPANSVKELIDYAKRNPGKLSFGSSGVGSVFHLTGELFNQNALVNVVHVPYKGVAPAMTGLVGNEVGVAFSAVSNALPFVRSGKARMLAVLESSRYHGLPDVPSIKEALVAYEKPASWFGFFGPPKLPQPILNRLNAEMVKALHAPDLRGKYDEAGLTILANTPEQFASLLRTGIEEFGKVIKAAGIKPE